MTRLAVTLSFQEPGTGHVQFDTRKEQDVSGFVTLSFAFRSTFVPGAWHRTMAARDLSAQDRRA